MRNIGNSVGWKADGSRNEIDTKTVETEYLLSQLREKRQTEGYSNMLLLLRMEVELQQLVRNGRSELTEKRYEEMVNQIHLDTSGKVVEPFEALADRKVTKEKL